MQQHDEDRIEDMNTDGEDHCFAAGTLVRTSLGPCAIEHLPATGVVLSVAGYAPYRSARLVKRNAPVVRLVFEDGYSVTCTPDHRFLVGIDEWRYACDLQGVDVICSQSLSAPTFKSSMDGGSTGAGLISSARERGSTDLSGLQQTGRSRAGFMSTTWTAIHQTIHWSILNAWHRASIWVNDMESNLASALLCICPRPELQPQSGMAAKPGENGIQNTSRQIFDRSWNAKFLLCASSVMALILSALSGSSRVNSVQTLARRVRCVRVEKLPEPADVYCLTVPSTGSFALAGGMIVANCADEWRYACMSRPWAKFVEVPKKAKFDTEMTINQLIERQKRKMREME